MTLISVIIPAHNEEGYITATLNSVFRQTLNSSDYEILVVANGCTDKTSAKVKELQKTRTEIKLSLLEIPIAKVSVARNYGAQNAQGKILIFLDADTLLEECSLETISQTINSKTTVGTCKGKPDTPKLLYYCSIGSKNLLHRTSLYKGSTGVIVCRSEAFKRIKGFDESLEVKEDRDLIAKLSSKGEYQYFSCTATTSMRRFEKQGAVKLALFWILQYYKKFRGKLSETKYEKIR